MNYKNEDSPTYNELFFPLFFFCFMNLFIIYLFIFGCVGFFLLRAGFLFSRGERGLLFVAVHRPLIKVASLVAEHGL